MKQYYTYSDIGSVLIGNEEWTFAVPNGIGDGRTVVRVYNTEKEFMESPWYKEGMHFLSSVQGTFGIFENDCDFHALLNHTITMKDAKCVLKGRYGVFNKNNSYNVAFVKWEDFENLCH